MLFNNIFSSHYARALVLFLLLLFLFFFFLLYVLPCEPGPPSSPASLIGLWTHRRRGSANQYPDLLRKVYFAVSSGSAALERFREMRSIARGLRTLFSGRNNHRYETLATRIIAISRARHHAHYTRNYGSFRSPSAEKEEKDSGAFCR